MRGTIGIRTALALTALAGAGLASGPLHAQGMVPIPKTPKTTKTPAGKPTVTGAPGTTIVAGSNYDFRPQASDPNGDRLTFMILRKPAWATFDAATGRLYGTPGKSDVGRHKKIKIKVTDGVNKAALPAFAIDVSAGQSPTISGMPSTSAEEGRPYTFQPVASDSDGQSLRFSISGQPAWASFDPGTGRLSGTPPRGSAGTYAGIVITVSDGANSASLPPFPVTVAATTNRAPVISGTPVAQVDIGNVYVFVPQASDPDGDPLQFRIVNAPAWSSFDKNTGRLGGTPTSGSEGTYADVIVSVTDGVNVSFLPAFSVTVSASNKPPVISGIPPTSAQAGRQYVFQPVAFDPEGQPLRFSVGFAPTWLSFDVLTGRLSGVAPESMIGKNYSNILVSVSDGEKTTTLPMFSITVKEATSTENQPPTISGNPPKSVKYGTIYSFRPTASDPDGQTLAFGIANKPAWASFDAATGLLSGTPAIGDAGSFAGIILSVSDGEASATLPPFSITVSGNTVPIIAGAPATSVKYDNAYSFKPTVTDPDGQTLAFGIANKPAWAAFDTVTGLLSGTPTTSDAGVTSNIVISVSDGVASATLPAFAITVSGNTVPTIGGSPSTSVTVGQSYSFKASATDPDGQTLAFGIANKPVWASFDTTTGQLSGTPQAANLGSYSNIVISVSDGVASATLPSFSIAVKDVVIGNAELTWSAPTQNTDGSALTNLAGYKVRYGSSMGALDKVVTVVGAGITSAVIEGLTSGTWYFTVSSYTNTGVESYPTSPVWKLVE